jgi:hypothetical protein
MISGTVEGEKDWVQRVMQLAGPEAMQRVGAGLYRGGQAIIADAVGLVPVDTGVLRDSAIVQEPVVNGDEVTVELGFGGAASDYAIEQHENLDYKHPNGGQAKYLETATTMNLITVQSEARDALLAFYREVTAGGAP